jgi:DNA-binding LacI/PurR family transcriptional regulator
MLKNTAPSLREVAKRLQVAPSTVSRALSGDGGINEKTATMIKQMARDMGYLPKPLRMRHSRTIGMIVCSQFSNLPDDMYQQQLSMEVAQLMIEHDWHIHLEVVTRDCPMPSCIAENRVQGVLLSGFPSRELCDRLAQRQLPVVVMDDLHQRTGLPSAISTVDHATSQVVQKLVAMGHRHFGYVTTTIEYPSVHQRQIGFYQGLEAAGIPTDNAQVITVVNSCLQQGQAATRTLLNAKQKPSCIIYISDRLALGGMMEMFRQGLDVPHDISLVGFDNSTLALDVDPPITSVDLNRKVMIRQSFDHLRRQIEDSANLTQTANQIQVHANIIWRASTGPCPLTAH